MFEAPPSSPASPPASLGCALRNSQRPSMYAHMRRSQPKAPGKAPGLHAEGVLPCTLADADLNLSVPSPRDQYRHTRLVSDHLRPPIRSLLHPNRLPFLRVPKRYFSTSASFPCIKRPRKRDGCPLTESNRRPFPVRSTKGTQLPLC